MLFSYVVYTLLVLVVCSATFYVWKNCNVRYSVLLIPSFCYAFLVGMRYDVGADWFHIMTTIYTYWQAEIWIWSLLMFFLTRL